MSLAAAGVEPGAADATAPPWPKPPDLPNPPATCTSTSEPMVTSAGDPASITIVNRSAQRGRELVRLIREKTPASAELTAWESTCRLPESTGIVVNATSIGLFPDVDGRLDLDVDSLQPHMVVADVIPNPPRTLLLRDAAARGCVTLDGLGMLVNQAVIGIRHWVGIDADPVVMRLTLAELFPS